MDQERLRMQSKLQERMMKIKKEKLQVCGSFYLYFIHLLSNKLWYFFASILEKTRIHQIKDAEQI